MLVDAYEKARSEVTTKLKKLNSNLTYHSIEHTFDVLEQSIRIAGAEGIKDEDELELLKIAALYHDTGFLRTYAEHEKMSCTIFLEDASKWGLSEKHKQLVLDLIMVTRIPQMPDSMLERIICDADLDYLGRNDFFTIGDELRKEFLSYKIISTNEEWDNLQFKFLKNHHYHTASSRQLREPVKQINFSKLCEVK